MRTVVLRDDRRERRVSIDENGRVSIDDVAIPAIHLSRGVVRVGDGPGRLAWVAAEGDMRWVHLDGEVYEFEVMRAGARRRKGAAHGSMSAPMPGTVVRVDVAPGATVRRGDSLVILEAMKMELPIRATADGVVKAVHCRPGDLVQPGVSLVDVE
jgi:acetyl/propionyl-CoA carboxylase alpha subunit